MLAIHLAFLLSPPLQYTDVFNYIHYGRMGALEGLNPYTVIPALAPHADASFALSNWRHLLSPYGPAFTLFSYALVPLGVAGSFWAIKLAVALASLGTLALVWRCAQLLGRSPASAVAFVGFNPIVLVWGLGADHNDSLMLFFVDARRLPARSGRRRPRGRPERRWCSPSSSRPPPRCCCRSSSPRASGAAWSAAASPPWRCWGQPP